MKTDQQIKGDVEQELAWNPVIDAGHIAVALHDGVVTLAGQVDNLLEKLEAERCVKRVAGVGGVANDIEVRIGTDARPDADIVHDAADLEARRISVDASGDIVTLRGTVLTWSEREAAERAAWQAPGVQHVVNQIGIGPPAG